MDESSPQVDQPQKPTKKSKTSLWVSLALVLGLVIGAGGVFVWKNSELVSVKNDLKAKEAKVSQLEKVTPKSSTFNCPGQLTELTDIQALQILTLESVVGSSVAQYWAPIIKIAEDYAKTSPLPVAWNAERGYEIPAMGGMTNLWHKKDGQWTKIGHCTEGGCEMNAGYEYDKLPKALDEQ